MGTKVVTGEVRLSYVHLFEKHRVNEKSDAKYSVMILIPKKDKATIEALRAAEAEAKEIGKTKKWGGKIPAGMKSIIHDGDETADDYPERAGHWHMNVSSPRKPGVVDSSLQPIMEESEVYSGCYARVSVSAYPYKHEQGGKGVSFGLNHVMKIRDGEALDGSSRAEEDFAEFAESDLV